MVGHGCNQFDVVGGQAPTVDGSKLVARGLRLVIRVFTRPFELCKPPLHLRMAFTHGLVAEEEVLRLQLQHLKCFQVRLEARRWVERLALWNK